MFVVAGGYLKRYGFWRSCRRNLQISFLVIFFLPFFSLVMVCLSIYFSLFAYLYTRTHVQIDFSAPQKEEEKDQEEEYGAFRI